MFQFGLNGFFLCYQRLAPAVKWLKLPQNQKCQFGQYFFNHKMPQVTKIFPVSAYFVSCTSIEDCQPKRHHIFPIFNEIDIMIIRHFWNVSHQNRYEIHFPRARKFHWMCNVSKSNCWKFFGSFWNTRLQNVNKMAKKTCTLCGERCGCAK